ncbi:pseudouridine synthase [Vararia minispora EC-137]|uniref:Pseudouridine synthase n=1 Tax=Vararia minispora EC-137 TaxID=1314806 RepID=A0ACB8QEE1_9AGAM|nr:pseudouridine synthase [Vararia minispora EC-137]
MAPEHPQDPPPAPHPRPPPPGLRKIAPYWYPYTTMAKERWLGREILEIVSTEFRDRSVEYYKYALESGVTTINGVVAKPDTVVRNGDRIENVVHRHEPPVAATPVRILHRDEEKGFIVIDKPGSIPVHATGRYFYLSLVEILQREFAFEKVYTVNRLDRLTSGLMVVALSSRTAAALAREFVEGRVGKEYVARCAGEFPEGETVVDQPLLTVDRQMGLNIVHPDGKPARTVFTRLRYDRGTNSSILHCRPLTGRSHQIRVHLQYLGFPIANDPIYSETKIWGPKLGKGGIDVTPSAERAPPAPPPELAGSTAEGAAAAGAGVSTVGEDVKGGDGATGSSDAKGRDTATEGERETSRLLPRETGHDIGMGSPVPLSAEAVGVITRLRNMKDEDEDWSRWRDVVFKAKGRLVPHGLAPRPLPPQNRRRRGGHGFVGVAPGPREVKVGVGPDPSGRASPPPPVAVAEENDGLLYCPECYLPLHPDPAPEKLYIFLHALRYTTGLGTFETEMPEWTREGFVWSGAPCRSAQGEVGEVQY